MGQFIELKAADGQAIPAYVARPAGTPKGGVVVIQEIFGVNSHIQSVADGYAAQGYLAVAPAIFHRVRPDVNLGNSPDDMSQGQALLRLQKYDEAEKLFARAEGNYTAAFGRNHVLTANAFQNQALADFESGDAARAAQRIAQAVAIYDKVLEGDHPTIGAALILQGRIRTAQGDYKASLAPLGTPTAFEALRGPRLRGGFVNRNYKVTYPDRTLTIVTYAEPGASGRYEQFLVMPAS